MPSMTNSRIEVDACQPKARQPLELSLPEVWHKFLWSVFHFKMKNMTFSHSYLWLFPFHSISLLFCTFISLVFNWGRQNISLKNLDFITFICMRRAHCRGLTGGRHQWCRSGDWFLIVDHPTKLILDSGWKNCAIVNRLVTQGNVFQHSVGTRCIFSYLHNL